MKNTILFLAIILLLSAVSCNKKENAKEAMMNDFVKTMKTQSPETQSSSLMLSRTEKTGNNEITLHFITPLSKEHLQPKMINEAVQDMMIRIIKKAPKNMQLLNKGVNFKVILTGKNNEQLHTEIINKSSMTLHKEDIATIKKQNQLNQMLEVSNGNLPVTDSATGITITKIALGNHNDVIYTAEVPDKMKAIVSIPENKSIIKSNMAKDKPLKEMLNELSEYDIRSLKYQYRSKNGKLLQEVEMRKQDFR
ncbi:MAG: hypothetical protein QM564_07555 [Bergeyella sp.]